MSNIKAILFDMDGVVTDTEEQYDIFLGKIQQEYTLSTNFVQQVKGTPLKDILIKYFSHLTEAERKEVFDKVMNFELNEMKYFTVPGVIDFIHTLKQTKYKIALVTSSLRVKVQVALKHIVLENIFDVIITADDVVKGKPDPQCYLKAAENLKVNPGECLVFEDSFAGIEAATKAGMQVVGLSTTNSEEELKNKVLKVIPDFRNCKIEQWVTEI